MWAETIYWVTYELILPFNVSNFRKFEDVVECLEPEKTGFTQFKCNIMEP